MFSVCDVDVSYILMSYKGCNVLQISTHLLHSLLMLKAIQDQCIIMA
jgi:hypothetical protein